MENEISINNLTYQLSEKEISKIVDCNGSIKEFIEKSANCFNPYYDINDLEIKRLIKRFVANKKITSLKSGLGMFVKCENGAVVDKSNNLYDFVSFSNDSNIYYSFEKIETRYANVPIGYNFYGTLIKYRNLESNIHSFVFKFLNDSIKETLSFISGNMVKEYFKDRNKKCLEKLTFDDFKTRLLRWRLFMLSETLFGWLESYKDNFEREQNISLEEMSNRINSLLDRYSLNGKSLFTKVEKLSDFKNSSGIYLLIMSSFRAAYIGQATSSIFKRVLGHIQHPTSGFDKSILPLDITEIYVLRTPKDLKMIDDIERDCIATLENIICVNSSIGGHNTIGSIHDKEYDSNKYLLNPERLKSYLNAIY